MVATIVIVGGGVYFFTKNDSSMAENHANPAITTKAEPGTFKGSIADLASRGGDWKCTIDSKSQTGAGKTAASGVVYVSGSKMKADFNITAPGIGAIKAFMIADGTNVYSWGSMMPRGVKVAQTQSWKNSTAPSSGHGMDANSSYSYDCDPAKADASLFVPPTNVSFMTI